MARFLSTARKGNFGKLESEYLLKSQYVEINLRFHQIALSLNKRGLRKGRTEEGGRRARSGHFLSPPAARESLFLRSSARLARQPSAWAKA